MKGLKKWLGFAILGGTLVLSGCAEEQKVAGPKEEKTVTETSPAPEQTETTTANQGGGTRGQAMNYTSNC